MSQTRWDETADLVVVGFGAAGAASAITGSDGGARIVLLEKQPATWHTPSIRASGGQVTGVIDAESSLYYFDRCAAGMIPIEVSRAWVERASDVIPWIETVVGVKMTRVAGAEHPAWKGAETVSAYAPAEAYQLSKGSPEVSGGASLFKALEAAVAKRHNIKVLYECSAQQLIQDAGGRVVGVKANTLQGVKRFEARRAVVLTCGGYGWNDDMKLDYLRASPIYFFSSPMNTGEGVHMAQAVGADLWHMNSMIGRAIAHFELNGKAYNFPTSVLPGGYVFTDKYGRRFANEHMQAMKRHDFYYELINYDAMKAEYPRIPCYWFFDARRTQVPIPGASGAAGPHKYQWSKDNADEIARGWIAVGADWESVAAQAGVADPREAARTIAEYNEGCQTKTDPFDRPAASLTPLDKAPFYCMKLWPGGSNTSGGPRRNESAQVVNVYGEPVPGLYEAGELGQAIGALYPANGANLSDALCFGRIAAEHALGLPRWTPK
jgi:succinate dehydrogenase/fumarate reductase flavoprotein subunit